MFEDRFVRGIMTGLVNFAFRFSCMWLVAVWNNPCIRLVGAFVVEGPLLLLEGRAGEGRRG